MRTPNHIAGGLVITGFCSALCGVNIFSSPLSIGVMVIASLLPDIDHPKSIIGRSLKPVALAINRRWGHRTLTHSAVALVCSTFLFALTEKGISGNTTLALVYFFAYFSHLLLDMVTLMGVPLLYPFSKNAYPTAPEHDIPSRCDIVLAIGGDEGLQLGTPAIEGAKVTAKVIGVEKGEKIYIQKFRRRKNYQRRTGHRQKYTRIEIAEIAS